MGGNPKAIAATRDAILDTVPEDTSLQGKVPELRFTYVPASHTKALHPDTSLVVGMRGAGKSFWWAALQERRHRSLIEKIAPRTGLTANAEVTVGFGERPSPRDYPSRDMLAQLMKRYEPRHIWIAVVSWHLASEGDPLRALDNWDQRVEYIRDNPERIAHLLYEQDQRFDERGMYWMILFDALDRSASDWASMNRLIQGLLQVALDFRPYRRLRVKCFLRTDQMDTQEVAAFPDASKILATKVELTWPARELYSLLWQHLGNHPAWRDEVASQFRVEWSELAVDHETAWRPPERLRLGEKMQRDVFHSMAGPWMGRDHRRGFPYTWVPNHLADAQGRTSPRSFLAALRKAAEDTQENYASHAWPLHYESIKRGVQAASSIRVQELQEDYPWVAALMGPLHGKVVPCDFDDIAGAWRQGGVLERLSKVQEQERLPPAKLDEGEQGVRRALEDLGIFLRLADGRVNIPDVFRVGYGVGRRGGVRPVARGGGR